MIDKKQLNAKGYVDFKAMKAGKTYLCVNVFPNPFYLCFLGNQIGVGRCLKTNKEFSFSWEGSTEHMVVVSF